MSGRCQVEDALCPQPPLFCFVQPADGEVLQSLERKAGFVPEVFVDAAQLVELRLDPAEAYTSAM